jgi:hypothetical protein
LLIGPVCDSPGLQFQMRLIAMNTIDRNYGIDPHIVACLG